MSRLFSRCHRSFTASQSQRLLSTQNVARYFWAPSGKQSSLPIGAACMAIVAHGLAVLRLGLLGWTRTYFGALRSIPARSLLGMPSILFRNFPNGPRNALSSSGTLMQNQRIPAALLHVSRVRGENPAHGVIPGSFTVPHRPIVIAVTVWAGPRTPLFYRHGAIFRTFPSRNHRQHRVNLRPHRQRG